MDLLRYERSLLEKGHNLICGIDEAGRGPLAGLVTVAAVIMDMDNIVSGVNDSKQLSEKQEKGFMKKYWRRPSAITWCPLIATSLTK